MGEELIAATISKIVNAGGLAGAATLVWRDGKVIQTAAVGRATGFSSGCGESSSATMAISAEL